MAIYLDTSEYLVSQLLGGGMCLPQEILHPQAPFLNSIMLGELSFPEL